MRNLEGKNAKVFVTLIGGGKLPGDKGRGILLAQADSTGLTLGSGPDFTFVPWNAILTVTYDESECES